LKSIFKQAKCELLSVCFISFGEEISWGQRIFGIETPAFIADANRQSELNFHNLYALSGGSTWLNFFKTGEFNCRFSRSMASVISC
jgi:hypothetical protein